jgi:integrase
MKIKHAQNVTEARRRAKVLLGEVAKERDPLEERKKATTAAGDTLKSIADSYLSREGKKLRSVERRRAALERLVFPQLGAQQIEEISRLEIARLLDKIEDENGPVQADAVLGFIRRIFNWHATRSNTFRSPIVRGMTRSNPSERAGKRILLDDELRAVWRAAGDFQGPFDFLVRFLLLTGVRLNEAARAPWSEINGAEWTVPSGRYKTKLDHLVPLSKAAQELLSRIPKLGGGIYVFPNRDGDGPFTSFSEHKRAFDERCGITGWRLHDLRRTARSLMSRAGVLSDHAERVLGHVPVGVRQTYDRYDYKTEKAAALEALVAQIARIVGSRPSITD